MLWIHKSLTETNGETRRPQTATPSVTVLLEGTQDWKDDTCHPEMQCLNNRVAAVFNSADVAHVCNWRGEASCKSSVMSTCCSSQLKGLGRGGSGS